MVLEINLEGKRIRTNLKAAFFYGVQKSRAFLRFYAARKKGRDFQTPEKIVALTVLTYFSSSLQIYSLLTHKETKLQFLLPNISTKLDGK